MQKTLFNLATKRTFGTSPTLFQEVAAKSAESAPRVKPSKEYSLKSTRTPSGLVVVSLENNSPLSSVCAFFRAGTRFETTQNEGVVHRIRNSCGLRSKNFSAVTINYETSFNGGLLECSSSREFLGYTVQCNRQNIFGALESSFTEILCAPDFRFYELDETNESLKIDHATLREDYRTYVLEMLHKAAYRTGGLARSLFAPNRLIGKHNEKMCQDFFEKHIVATNGALVGLGVDHEQLLRYAAEMFPLQKGSPAAPTASKYFGGELRKERGGNLTVVALAGEGVSLQEPKAVAAQAVLAHALGAGPNVQYNDGASRLPKAIKGATSNPFFSTAFNLNYSDSGLFGVLFACHDKDSAKVTKAALDALKSASSLTDADLKSAKAKATFSLLDQPAKSIVEDLGAQSILKPGSYVTAADMVQTINSISANDVSQVAKKVASSKLTMAAIGSLDDTPYLDELAK